jgi:2,3-bisphosphoglycerate-dependent phosphoglycerate mutase
MFWKTSHRLENIFLMRHGNSAANADTSLTATIPDHIIGLAAAGFGQAAAAGAAFRDYIGSGDIRIGRGGMRLWCSPYRRTIQTRDSFLDGFGPEYRIFRDMRTDILLTEQRFGLFDGLSDEEKAERYPAEYRQFRMFANNGGKFYAKNPNGESRYDVCVRVRAFNGTITRDAEKKRNSVPNVFVISHGTTIRAFVMNWLHLDVDWFENEPNPNNASIRRIGRDENGKWKDFGCIFEGFPDQEAVRKAKQESTR